jgi:outer membrane protein assembly complex protein YaeT
MSIDDPADPLLPPHREKHHRSARERQRRGPMWGCLKALIWVFGGVAVLLVILIGGGWFYLGTSSFAGLVKLRIEKTLETRLGRHVTIGSVEIVRTRPQHVILNDLRIANAPGGKAPYFATARQIEITGGVESFWGRAIQVDRVDVRDPHLWFEVFPTGSPLVHNFPHWTSGPKARYEIVHLTIGKMFVSNGAFDFLDRKHDITALSTKLDAQVTVTQAEDLYEGIMSSPLVRVRLQDYEPFDLDLRGGFRFTPNKLALRSVALKGRGIEAFLSGNIAPLADGVYNLRVTSQVALERIREIFRVEKLLAGTLALDTRLRGKQGEFTLQGGWTTPKLTADAYDLTNAKGTLDVRGDRMAIDVTKAGYGGGSIGAHFTLAKYAEPYPMQVDLRYYGIALEQLFNDWTIENTGIRAAATGQLSYHWNKDKVLEGAGEGTAKLSKNAVAFSNARYPIGIGGDADFALNRGVVTFRRAELDTDHSHVSLTGTLAIEKVITNLRTTIRSADFSELDRLGYNFAHSAGKKDYTLLGLGGGGTIEGTVSGPIDKPLVAAHIVSSATQYNNVLLGDSDIDLRYDGNKSTLTFERATFVNGQGRLALTGTIGFPDNGKPRFDIAVDANAYPAQRAIDAVGLDLKIGEGLATGRLIVAGTPDDGRATFVNLNVRRANASLALNGTLHWLPGKGNVAFDLDIAATNFPVADIIAFLDLGTFPVSGDLTGKLRLSGTKQQLEGSGTVAVTNGVVYGEPVNLASADITFTQGRARLTNVLVQAPAGEIRGEAEVDLNNQNFSYNITSSNINLSKLKLLESLKGLLGGNVVLKSTGAGTFAQPELVVEATLNDATLRGLSLPAGAPPPSLYIAIRNGRLVVRGNIADLVTIEGEGAVGANLAVDGNVRVTISDIARALAVSPATASLPASGNIVVDLKLGGHLTPLEALTIDATAPVFNLQIADETFATPEPLHVALRNGRVELDTFVLKSGTSMFSANGFAELVGAKRLNVDIRGRVEAALLQLFATGLRADGHMDVAMSIDGTVTAPQVTGTAELKDAQVKFAGFPQLIDQINGRLNFRGDRIEIEQLRATVGGGTIVMGGAILLDGIKPQSARITLQGTDVAIRYYEGVTVQGNFTLLLSGDLDKAVLTGDVDVTRALYFRDFDIQQTLLNVILARSRVTPVSAATWQDRIGLRLHLNAPGTLAVRNNIADVTGSATLDVTGTVANPVILGEVTLDEGGTVRIQNVDYRVSRGTVAFQNPFRIDPYFDVTIEGTVNGFGSDAESGPYDVTVNITGTLDRITPTITSDPPASDITLFSILGFGGIGMGTNPGSQQPVGAVGQSLLYQSLVNLVGARVFPFVDSFAYDPGTLETGTGSGPKVTFEKRLSPKIRFLLVYWLDNQQSRQVLEWTVNRDYSLQLTRDQTDEYRIDARFRRRYDARWNFRHAKEEDYATAATISSTTSGATTTTAATTSGPNTVQATATTAAAAPPPLPVTAVNARAAEGKTITRIDLRADARFDTATVAQEVTLKPGQPVTVREMQSSIKNLFATGNFRDIRVDAANDPAGVVLTFSLFLHYRVNRITISGVRRAERTRAERELTVRPGEVLSLDDVNDSALAVEDMLHRYGYLESTVDPSTTFDRARNIADVTLEVTLGPLAKVSNVVLEGNTAPYTAAQLIARMKRRPGRTFERQDARFDAERMKTFLLRHNYRRADVTFVSDTYDAATHTVALRYRVNVGPTVQVAVKGVPRSMVRKWLPFARNQEYSEDAVDKAADDITRGLQERGYYLAAVDTESSLAGSVWTTTFNVSPGPKLRLAGVTFSGNAKVSDKALQKLVATSPSGGIKHLVATIFRRPTGVTREQLSGDRDSLESYYRLNGFSDATVATPVVTPNDAAGTMTVDFPITEGPQTILTAVNTEGIDQKEHGNAPKPVLKAGDPLNPQLEHNDVVALQTYYADAGHTEVQVAPRVDISTDKTQATLTYAVTEGPHVSVGSVVVRGNTYTDRDVVLRTADIHTGQPFSYTALLAAQRNLYRLGIFNRVEVQPEQAGTTVADRDVALQVEEGRNLTMTGSIGLRAQRGTTTGSGIQIQPRVALAAAHRNLFGTGRYLGIETVLSSGEQKEQEAFITYREPFISRWNVPLQLQIFQTDDATRPGTRILQRGTSIEITKVALTQTRWSLRYEYKISDCREGDVCEAINTGDPVEGIDRSLLNISISSLTPTFFWDTRDDIIDPHRGFFTSASVEYAFPLFAASANFTKEFAQGAYYLPLSEHTVLALSSRLGLIQPHGSTTHNDVPLSERFTAGGETTHRGFMTDLLGTLCQDPRDFDRNGVCQPTLFRRTDPTTHEEVGPVLPLGGSGLLLFNAEYRFPIFSSLGGALFADAGNVYKDDTIRFDMLRYGLGLGVRYLSPVGPLRFDLGWPLQRRERERAFTYFISLGYAF